MCGNGKCVYYGCAQCYRYLPPPMWVVDYDGQEFCSEECVTMYKDSYVS